MKTFVYPDYVAVIATNTEEAELLRSEGAWVREYVRDSKTGIREWDCQLSKDRAVELGYAKAP